MVRTEEGATGIERVETRGAAKYPTRLGTAAHETKGDLRQSGKSAPGEKPGLGWQTGFCSSLREPRVDPSALPSAWAGRPTTQSSAEQMGTSGAPRSCSMDTCCRHGAKKEKDDDMY